MLERWGSINRCQPCTHSQMSPIWHARPDRVIKADVGLLHFEGRKNCGCSFTIARGRLCEITILLATVPPRPAHQRLLRIQQEPCTFVASARAISPLFLPVRIWKKKSYAMSCPAHTVEGAKQERSTLACDKCRTLKIKCVRGAEAQPCVK